TPNGTMAHTRSSQIWLKKIKVVHTLLNMNSPKYKLSTPNSFVTIGCFRGEGVPILKTLFEQRFLKSHFQIAITRKVFKLAPSNFLGLKYDTITCQIWTSKGVAWVYHSIRGACVTDSRYPYIVLLVICNTNFLYV